MKKKLVILSLIILLAGCQTQAKLTQYKETTFQAGFDTVFTLIGYTEDQEEFDEYFKAMQDMTYHYHQLYDKYHDYENINNIKTINDNAGIDPVIVDQAIIDLLLLAKEYYQVTDGYFDVTIGSVLNLWHACREEANDKGYGCVPTYEDLSDADQHTGWDLVEINDEDNTVYISDPEASLDVGGIAKGYAVEQVAIALEDMGLKYGAVDGGGNIRTINSKPDSQPFTVGITNPDQRGGPSVDILEFQETYAFVTSGDYERYYVDQEGNKYHHIIDPDTLYPSESARSVTIVYPDSGIADILSTACYIMDYETAVAFIDKFSDERLSVIWLYDTDDHPDIAEGFVIDGYFELIHGNVHTANGE